MLMRLNQVCLHIAKVLLKTERCMLMQSRQIEIDCFIVFITFNAMYVDAAKANPFTAWIIIQSI